MKTEPLSAQERKTLIAVLGAMLIALGPRHQTQEYRDVVAAFEAASAKPELTDEDLESLAAKLRLAREAQVALAKEDSAAMEGGHVD